MARGTGRMRRLSLLEEIEKTDPDRYARLLELRHYNPQAYRKALRTYEKRRAAEPSHGAEAPPPVEEAPTPKKPRRKPKGAAAK